MSTVENFKPSILFLRLGLLHFRESLLIERISIKKTPLGLYQKALRVGEDLMETVKFYLEESSSLIPPILN